MTLDELKKKRIIDVEDDIEFRTHADVMRLFGTDQKLIQRSFIKHPHEDGTRIWFPMFYDDDNNDWINTASKDYGRVFEKKKAGNDKYLAELISTPRGLEEFCSQRSDRQTALSINLRVYSS